MAVQEFKFHVHHLPGISNIGADVMSRYAPFDVLISDQDDVLNMYPAWLDDANILLCMVRVLRLWSSTCCLEIKQWMNKSSIDLVCMHRMVVNFIGVRNKGRFSCLYWTQGKELSRGHMSMRAITGQDLS